MTYSTGDATDNPTHKATMLIASMSLVMTVNATT